eukprot:1176324-Pyramimonas_sp.AAC.1
MYKFVPKFHLWEHLTEIYPSLMGNPRYFWTYSDEDLVGLAIGIAESVHPSTLGFSVFFLSGFTGSLTARNSCARTTKHKATNK